MVESVIVLQNDQYQRVVIHNTIQLLLHYKCCSAYLIVFLLPRVQRWQRHVQSGRFFWALEADTIVAQIQFEEIRFHVMYAVHTALKKSDLGQM